MRVLLVHGLGRTPLSMALLARRLRRGGHMPESFGYLPTTSSYDVICRRLDARVRSADTGKAPWVAIGHSLGGLLLRDAITTAAPAHLAHLVMLATPNRLPRMATHASRVAPFRWFAGECGQRLATPGYFARLPELRVPYTVFAGTRGIRGRWSPFGDDPNDGIVAVSETVLDPESPPVLVSASHTFIMNHALVQATILEILAGVD